MSVAQTGGMRAVSYLCLGTNCGWEYGCGCLGSQYQIGREDDP